MNANDIFPGAQITITPKIIKASTLRKEREARKLKAEKREARMKRAYPDLIGEWKWWER